jgi:plasmid stabilization system protein ParE
MKGRVRLSTLASRDLARQRAYMTQPGAGQAAAAKLAALLARLGNLPDREQLYPEDRSKAGYRVAIVGGFVIQFRRDDAGNIFVRRIFGPGQDRI